MFHAFTGYDSLCWAWKKNVMDGMDISAQTYHSAHKPLQCPAIHSRGEHEDILGLRSFYFFDLKVMLGDNCGTLGNVIHPY